MQNHTGHFEFLLFYPKDIKLVVSRQIEGKSWKLDKLLEILKIEVEAHERCTLMNVDSPVAKSGCISSSENFPDSIKFTSKESIKPQRVLYLQVLMLRNLIKVCSLS